MTRLEYFKRWWTNRFGTITRENGRWFRYLQHYNQLKVPQTDEHSEITVVYSFHKVVSARWFYQLFYKAVKWPFLTMPDDTKFWIENSKSNIFRPGMDFREVIKDFKGPVCLVIATPWEGDNYYMALSQYDCDKAFVACLNKREQVLFKLSHT